MITIWQMPQEALCPFTHQTRTHNLLISGSPKISAMQTFTGPVLESRPFLKRRWPDAQDESLDDKDALYAVFDELMDSFDFTFKQGDVVSGTVFEIDQKGAYVDIGAKAAAFCPTAEASLCKIARVRACVPPARELADLAEQSVQR